MEYQPVNPIEPLLHSILAQHFPSVVIGATRFVGNGSVNAVYATQAGEREFIVRLADARYRGDEPNKEAWCLERAQALGVPGPKVFATGQRDQTVYMIQEFIEGVHGDDLSLDQEHIWEELGCYARRIHQSDITDFCGRESFAPDWAEAEWERFVEYGLDSLTPHDALIALGVYTPAQQPQIRAVFERLQRQSFHFGLTHNDLSLWNTLVTAEGKVLLFDWGCAEVAIVPHVEISSILRWLHPEEACFRAFLRGYHLSEKEWREILPQIEDYQLLKSFDLVRWAIDKRPEEIENYAATARKQMERRAMTTDEFHRVEQNCTSSWQCFLPCSNINQGKRI